MMEHNGHCLGEIQTGTSAEDRMHHDQRGNENNSNKSVGEMSVNLCVYIVSAAICQVFYIVSVDFYKVYLTV